ncbi:MAG TPA: potassium channel family protein [Bacillus sp. (in: firmicutes)]|uniref:potassium channel family protein n=1 Tax=Bacillus litorisediminis TaxID=2922713 RepID=UPI001FAE6275|nr:potassium channel family protein [Bacillus litorisediminis]HWO74698.1 potassium channel family protein [Bacillus sp. (in: firmicutes)]
MVIVFLIIIIFILSLSLSGVVTDDRSRRPKLSSYTLYYLSVYLTVLIGFALLYLILTLNGITVIKDLESSNYFTMLTDSLYVSGVTLFAVGYGDFVPIGIGKLIAIIEAFTGYMIPTSFVIKVVREEAHRSFY